MLFGSYSMGEFLRSNPESFDDVRENNSNVVEPTFDDSFIFVGEQNDSIENNDDYDDEGGYSDEYGHDDEYDDGYYDDEEYGYESDDGYYSEYEEQHYGEERYAFNEEKLTLQEIALPDEILKRYSFLGELPHGIAVMGGVARSIAREIIAGVREPIRDIDLVNIVNKEGNSEVAPETLDVLSRKYMPDDYSFGHGIGNDTLENYFKTRDFTINQCLIQNGKLIVSDFAYNDFRENIIRPTYYEHSHDGDDVSSRLFLKALMMRSVLSQISDSVPLIEDMEPPSDIRPFDIALFLNKAMSRGAETARAFTGDLADWDVISGEYVGRPIALAKDLMRDVYAFKFRPSTDERFKDVQECADMDGFFVPPVMLDYHASDPSIRHAIAEYEDGLGSDLNAGEERYSGRYTQTDYDDINRSVYDE